MAEQDGLLVAEAMALGIDVDGRWGDDTLRRKIGEKRKEREASGGEAAGEGAAADAVPPATGGAADHAGTADDGGASTGSAGEGAGSAEAGAAGDGEAATGGSADAGGSGEGEAAGGGAAPELAAGNAGGTEALGSADAAGSAGGEPDGNDAVVAAGTALTGDDDAGQREGVAEGAAREGEAEHDPGGTAPPDAGGGAGAGEGEPPPAPPVPAQAAGGAEDGRDGADVSGEQAAATAAAAGDEGEAEAVTADAGDGSAGVDTRSDYDRALDAMRGPIQAAFDAACVVWSTPFAPQPTDSELTDVTLWIGDGYAESIIAIVTHGAPFVRAYPDAPPAALYGHVKSDGGKHLALPVLYEDMPLRERLAWIVFRDTLLSIDREVRAEQARQAQAEPAPPAFVPIGGTVLEEVDEPFATQAPGGDRIF